MEITTELIQAIVAGIIAIIAALTAIWQNRQKNTIIEAYTPGTTASNTPAVITTLPPRSWKMDDSTKRFITFDCPPEVKADILRQVDEAEAASRVEYTITFPGGNYKIQYGIQYSATGNCSSVKKG